MFSARGTDVTRSERAESGDTGEPCAPRRSARRERSEIPEETAQPLRCHAVSMVKIHCARHRGDGGALSARPSTLLCVGGTDVTSGRRGRRVAGLSRVVVTGVRVCVWFCVWFVGCRGRVGLASVSQPIGEPVYWRIQRRQLGLLPQVGHRNAAITLRPGRALRLRTTAEHRRREEPQHHTADDETPPGSLGAEAVAGEGGFTRQGDPVCEGRA